MLKTLRRIIQEVNSSQDFREALEIIVKRVAKALDADACSIFLLDQIKNDYVLMATRGLNPQAVGKVRIPSNQGLIGLVGEREEPINIDDASQHPRFLHIPEVKEEPYRAFLGTPIIYHRKVLGVLIVQQKEPRKYDEAEEAFLVTLAAQLAAAIAHADAIGSITALLNSHKTRSSELHFAGIPSSPGVGIGFGVVLFPSLDLDSIPDREPEDIEMEIRMLEMALAAGREEFRVLGERICPNLPTEERALFDVYQRLLDTTDLGAEIIQAIRQGNWAPGALRQVVQNYVERLENLENEYLRERAIDIKNLGYRVLVYLQNDQRALPQYHSRTILIGEELTAADLAEVPEGCLAGIICMKGSVNSHVAILARAMGIPAIMGVENIPIYELQGKEIIVDGFYGQIHVSPRAALRQKFEDLAREERKLDASLEHLRNQLAKTKDGHRVTLMANTGFGIDINMSLAAGAEGVGLYRSESPFLLHDRFPSSEEQRVIYKKLLASFAPHPVTMRTLDVGGDKNLPYFPVNEDNPFLGWRGIRITLDHPEIFLVQARAMMRASEGHNNLRIMLPMITDVGEVNEALRLLKKAYHEVLEEGHNIEIPPVGAMIEVPSAVYQARALAKRVDFLSVGSNDLTQYTLAVDRNNSRVANLYDSLHPSVLRSLLMVVEAGHQEGKHVAICGEMAGDPAAALLLVAMGFDSLSMSAASLPRIKWLITEFTLKKAKKLLQEVLGMENGMLIRCHMELALEEAGLGKLIRTRKKEEVE